MHDAAEAYVGDLLRAVKKYLPEYKTIENRVLKAIGQRYGISEQEFVGTKEADNIMLATEAFDIMPKSVYNEFFIANKDKRIKLKLLTPIEAEQNFLNLAEVLL